VANPQRRAGWYTPAFETVFSILDLCDKFGGQGELADAIDAAILAFGFDGFIITILTPPGAVLEPLVLVKA